MASAREDRESFAIFNSGCGRWETRWHHAYGCARQKIVLYINIITIFTSKSFALGMGRGQVITGWMTSRKCRVTREKHKPRNRSLPRTFCSTIAAPSHTNLQLDMSQQNSSTSELSRVEVESRNLSATIVCHFLRTYPSDGVAQFALIRESGPATPQRASHVLRITKCYVNFGSRENPIISIFDAHLRGEI